MEIKLAQLKAKQSKIGFCINFDEVPIRLSIQFLGVKECGFRMAIFTTQLFGYFYYDITKILLEN